MTSPRTDGDGHIAERFQSRVSETTHPKLSESAMITSVRLMAHFGRDQAGFDSERPRNVDLLVPRLQQHAHCVVSICVVQLGAD
jgi:hypothetical protein